MEKNVKIRESTHEKMSKKAQDIAMKKSSFTTALIEAGLSLSIEELKPYLMEVINDQHFQTRQKISFNRRQDDEKE